MRKLATATGIITFVSVLNFAAPSHAHNVWCHCSFSDPRDTVEFFHKAGAVYEALSKKVVLKWHQANSPLEQGVLAEFEQKLDNKKALQPDLFRQTLARLTELRSGLDELASALADMGQFVATHEVTPIFDLTVVRLLNEDRPIERLSETGVRYAEVSGITGNQGAMEGIAGIIRAQQQDLRILKDKLSEVIVGLRDAIPLAENGQFAAVMLSGRNSFGDKMPQFTDMIHAYDRLYVRTCMSTIAATMQIYPRGFEWVK